ncbi:polar tube protein Ptp2 [Encephalitozoon intestinalis]
MGGMANGCTNKKLDGVEIMRRNMVECQKRNAEATKAMVERANEKAVETFNKEVSKGPQKESGQCIEKAVQGTDRCILAGIIDKAVNKRKYRISDVENSTSLYRGDKLIALIVNVDYGLQPIIKPKKKKSKIMANLPQPKREMYFNQIGQLVGAKGTFPQDNKDECKPCEPKKTVETASERCNLGCELKGTSALISKAIQKKEIKESPKEGDRNTTQEYDGEGSAEDAEGQQPSADGEGLE